MKTAIFEHGKQTLSEWIEKNSDCEKMILIGKASFDEQDKHSFDLLFNFDNIAKDFHPTEFDISDMHLLHYDGNVCDDIDEYGMWDNINDRPSLIFKMLANRKYSTTFIYNDNILTTPDRKVIVYHKKSKHVIVPKGIEIIGNWSFAFDNIKTIDLPNGLKEFGSYSFYNVNNLIELAMPDSVEKLGEGTFCYAMIDIIKISDKIVSFPEYCFRYCEIDKLPSSLKTIESENCFELANNNITLEFPHGFEHLGSYSIGSFEKIHLPSTTKYIAEDFWYDSIVGQEESRKPTIIIAPDNPYLSVDKNNEIVYKYVTDVETTKRLSRKAISFVVSETERNFLLEKDIMLSPKDMINLVSMSPESSKNKRTWFYWDLAHTSILTDLERSLLSYVRQKHDKTWDQLHTNLSNRKFLAFGILYDHYIQTEGRDESYKEFLLGEYPNSWECARNICDSAYLKKYDKIIVKQYKINDKKLENELGRFEIENEWDMINNLYHFDNYPTPQNISDIFNVYIDLPHPFEPGDIVKVKNYRRQYVVAESFKPSKEQIESKYVDSSDMAVTVLPIECLEKVRECVRQGNKIPEELFSEHAHISFLCLEMVEKYLIRNV